MQTLTFLSPGRVEWCEAPSPRLGGPTEALIRPLAVAACDLDAAIVGGRTPFPGPFALGHEFAGEVVDIGDDVTGIAVGDRVAVAFQPSCGGCAPCRRGHSAACSTAPGTPMYGIGAAGGDWGGALADTVRVPYPAAMLAPLPAGVTPAMAAGASDNIADGYRTVAPALEAQPGASVLVAGSGSIALYAAWWARTLGAGSVTLASRDHALLASAKRHGIDVLPVADWPRRFATHTITVDCTGEPAGLAALIRATEAYGWCTSAAIYFGGDIPMPLFDMNMKGIRFDTGRVNGAAALPTVLELIARHGLTPATIGATEVGWQSMREALIDGAFKPIAVRD
ncbi:MAG: alcohol dehydrogenase catalytic domain-containing protein [Pseudomonadales bacterium]